MLLAVQVSAWRAPIDPSHLLGEQPVADELLEPRRETTHQGARDAELLIDLLPQEAGAEIDGEGRALLRRAVRAGGVPQGPVPDQGGTRWHFDRLAVRVRRLGHLTPPMRAGHDARPAVF